MRSRTTPNKTTASRNNITLAVGVRNPAGHILGYCRDTMLAGKVSEKVGNAVVGLNAMRDDDACAELLRRKSPKTSMCEYDCMFPKRYLACGRGVSRRIAADVTKALLDNSYGHRRATSPIGRCLREFVLSGSCSGPMSESECRVGCD